MMSMSTVKDRVGPRQGVRLSGRREPFPGGSTSAVQAADALEEERPMRSAYRAYRLPTWFFHASGCNEAFMKVTMP